MNKVTGLEKVQATIREVKRSREMGTRYMTFEELSVIQEIVKELQE